MRTNYSENLEGDSTFAKSATLRRNWSALSKDEKSAFSAIAQVENEEAKKHQGEDFVEFCARCRGEGVQLSETQRARHISDKLRAIKVSIDKMINHKVFRSGSQLHEFDCGLRRELIRDDLTM